MSRRSCCIVHRAYPAVADFAATTDGPIHFVGHSMGGLLTRVYLARYRPARLGRVVMLGTPNGGSELADLLKGLAIYRAFYGPAGLQTVDRHRPHADLAAAAGLSGRHHRRGSSTRPDRVEPDPAASQ